MMRLFWPILLVVSLSVALYANSLNGEFVIDDWRSIVENRTIRDLFRLPSLFLQPLGPGLSESYYRPLVMVSYAFNNALGGLNPFGCHLVNLLLHTGVCVLVYFLCLRVFTHTGPALAAALLFTVHPIHTEAVSWIWGRSEPLSALFFLGAWLLYLRSRVVLSALVFFFALLSKENALVFPGVIVLSDLFFHRDKSWRGRWEIVKQRLRGRYLLYVGVLSFYLVARYLVLGQLFPPVVGSIGNPAAALPFVLRSLTALRVLGMYLWRLVAPIQLSFDYSYNQIPVPISSLEPDVVLTVVVLIGLTLLAVLTIKRRPQIPFGLGFFFITFAPVSNFLVFGAVPVLFAERFMYLPSLGFCLFMVGLGQEVRTVFPQHRPLLLKYASLTALSMLIALYSVRLVMRNREWKDEWTLFQSALKVSPRSALVRFNVGITLANKGRLQEAWQSFQEALRIMPSFVAPYNGLGIIYIKQGRFEEAEKELQRALAIDPKYVPARYNLGILYLTQRRRAEGERELQTVLKMDPNYTLARQVLADLHRQPTQAPQ